MQAISVGAGLAALGFWIFLTAVSVVGMWAEARKREARHETLRRMIEGGQTVDQALADKLLALDGGGDGRLDRDLRVAGLIVLSAAPGLAVLGWLVGMAYPPWLLPLLGVAALVGCVSIGLLIASSVLGRWNRRDDTAASRPSKA